MLTAPIATGKRVIFQSSGVRPAGQRRTTVVLALLVCLALMPTAGAQESVYLLPGKPESGMRIFLSKGCVRCHAVLGEGGKTAPDLGKTPAGQTSLTELVTMMWNHAPRMWEGMNGEGIPIPTFTSGEIEDLFAFLYSVRSLDMPGDAAKGKALLRTKQCVVCHEVQGVGGHVGPELSTTTWYENPVQWAQQMWNHSEVMEEAMRERGIAWPEFQENDMAHLLAYLRSVTPPPDNRPFPRSADPKAGEALFEGKGCRNCHPLRGSGARTAPDLGEQGASSPRTLAQFAGLMWNHMPQMRKEMEAQGVTRPLFSDKEMADLIAYLYAVRYFDEPGDPISGRNVFVEKGCGRCHVPGSAGGSAPDLNRWAGHLSPVVMARAVWNHGSAMQDKIRQVGVQWPTFAEREMADLIAFLNQEGSSR